MPTLRDDIKEARERMTAVREELARKLVHNVEWTLNDKVQSIDAFDCTIEMANLVLPVIPQDAVRGTARGDDTAAKGE